MQPSLRYCLTVIMSIIVSSALTPVLGQTAAEEITLDNGMQVILKESHNSSMIASMIFVKSGSKYESRFENGITHFLEHLLFDGTVSQTREELDLSIRNLGGYINAFTRKDFTAYFILVPKQYIDYGLTVQADMLFCSTIPDEELAKERKVVIEEINQSADRAGAPAEAFFTEKAYAGTDYSRPVLGYAPFIENIPREAIVAYWKKYYRPDNMVMLIIGDFEPEPMKQTITNIFGQFAPAPAADSAQPAGLHSDLLKTDRIQTSLTGQSVLDTVADVKSTYVNFSFEAPQHEKEDYLPMSLLTEYLSLDEVSPLKNALLSGESPLASEVGVHLETRSDFSRLEVSVITDQHGRSDEIVRTVLDQLQGLADHTADPEAIRGIKTSIRCDNIYMSERLHYYGIIIAPALMTTGWDFVQNYPDLLEKVIWSDCQRVAGQWFSEPRYVATITRPAGESGAVPYVPAGITAEEVIAHFDTATYPEYDLAAAVLLEFPATDSISFDIVDRAEYYHQVLDNGLTVIIKSSPDSKVFAVNVLGKNRTASEPADKVGITDMVNRLLEKGTLSRSASELARDLASVGANLTLYDNPWIPYDDRYTTRRYSFVKFETIDEYAREGFGLMAELLTAPAFDSANIEEVRTTMIALLGREATSPTKLSRDLFYSTLFEGKAYEHPVMGSRETISSIGADDLREHHRRIYSPDNMIMSIATGRSIPEVLTWVNATLGRLAPSARKTAPGEIADPLPAIKRSHVDLDKEQIGIYIGNTLPGANHEDATALSVATSILSSRIYLNLREKQGLAYSTGAGARFDPDFGWYWCSIGTAAENYQTALDGLVLQIDKLSLDGPTQEEVNRARNALWGRLMSAKLSRINQAYYLGVDSYLGRPVGHDRVFLDELRQVTPESIRRVASQYFRTNAYVLATAGRRP